MIAASTVISRLLLLCFRASQKHVKAGALKPWFQLSKQRKFCPRLGSRQR